MTFFFAVLCLGSASWADAGADDGWGAYLAGDHHKALQLARPAAEAGDVGAQGLLGYLYWTGDEVPKDHAQAQMWFKKYADQCKKLAEQGDQIGEHGLGWLLQNGWGGLKQDYAQATKWYEKAAEQGNQWSQFSLGGLYQNGWGVKQDYAEAAKWYRRSADQGNPSAQGALGNLYYTGLGVKQDYAEAINLARKSADQGNQWGERVLGSAYQNGLGVKQDYAEAAKWYRKSAEQGDSYAQWGLGYLCQVGLGVQQDYDEAAKLYRRSADQGNELAQQALGWLYQNGWGVKQDSAEGLKWARKSADQGNQWGERLLGLFYQNGWGVKQDYAEAAKWLRKSAEQGNPYGQNELGSLYYNGTGFKQDYAQAAQWYRKSAEQGHPDAQWLLAWLYQNGWGVKQDYAEAFKWYKKSSDQGNPFGQNGAATFYFWGWGVKQDDAEAARLWQLAADQGSPYAPNGLGTLYRTGRPGFPKESAKALKWFRTGIARGELAYSPVNLGGMYEGGEGVIQDYVEAYKWYLIGAAHDGPGAREGIERLKGLMTKEQIAEAQKLAAASESANHGQAPAPPPQPAAPEKKIVSDVDEPGFRFKENPMDFAVVIGVENYKDLPRAAFAERDAEAVREHLVAMGYPERNVLLLKGPNATISGLKKYVDEWLPRNVPKDGTVFFYFSGHGAPDPKTGEAYLVPWDGDAGFLKSTAYPVKKLYASLGALPAAKVWVALDSCFSGGGGRSVLAKGARPLVTKGEGMLVPKGKLVLLAAASGEEITGTLDAQGHGIFTYYLLKGIGDAAKRGGAELDAQKLYDYLKPKVQDSARRQNRDQTPVLAGAFEEGAP